MICRLDLTVQAGKVPFSNVIITSAATFAIGVAS